MRTALESHMLRRCRSQVSPFSPPTSEVTLPVMMTQQQRECYKAHLARAFEVLTDPKTPRQNSHRGGQLRTVCSSLKKVGCCQLWHADTLALSFAWLLSCGKNKTPLLWQPLSACHTHAGCAWAQPSIQLIVQPAMSADAFASVQGLALLAPCVDSIAQQRACPEFLQLDPAVHFCSLPCRRTSGFNSARGRAFHDGAPVFEPGLPCAGVRPSLPAA